MDQSIIDKENFWRAFLERWPLEKLPEMTLQEYTAPNTDDSFCYWLEKRTETLGSIWGGSAFKFGVYARKDKSPKENANGRCFGTDYAWMEKYGASPDAAFQKVRQEIVTIAKAARTGDLQTVDKADLGEVTRWKIAFLYQDPAKPCVLPLYKKDHLQKLVDQPKSNLVDCHSTLLAQRGDMPLFAYGAQLWLKSQSIQPESSLMNDIPTSDRSQALNQILYGPPGTGKTYSTTELAVQIAEPDWFQDERDANEDKTHWRASLKQKYDELVAEKRIAFTTFHQSFSYEDFIEGIRATPSSDGDSVAYTVEDGVFKALADRAEKSAVASSQDARKPNYVLIIDEINRGNIARIFGELITLLEPDKRKGGEDARSVILPYSKKSFAVPSNLHVIGTMNTADKSLTQLDLALRRRFEFKEIMPDPELLRNISVHNINIATLLATINSRIEVLLDRDHLIGHSYFLPLTQEGVDLKEVLAGIFRNKIIPLLQEYFFADWEKISWVLNDIDKPKSQQFIQLQSDSSNLSQLFSRKIVEELHDRRYVINHHAFTTPDSYRLIIVNEP